jgi:hypothetical protein
MTEDRALRVRAAEAVSAAKPARVRAHGVAAVEREVARIEKVLAPGCERRLPPRLLCRCGDRGALFVR